MLPARKPLRHRNPQIRRLTRISSRTSQNRTNHKNSRTAQSLQPALGSKVLKRPASLAISSRPARDSARTSHPSWKMFLRLLSSRPHPSRDRSPLHNPPPGRNRRREDPQHRRNPSLRIRRQSRNNPGSNRLLRLHPKLRLLPRSRQPSRPPVRNSRRRM